MKHIFYFGHGWADNIGNAFIDYGVNYCLKKAVADKDIKITNISNVPPYNDFKFGKRFPFNWLSGFSRKERGEFDLRTHTKPDLVVLGGSLFNIYWCKVHSNFLEWLINEQHPVLVLGGGGGNDYTEDQLSIVQNYWDKINFAGYISRDRKALQNFQNFAGESYDGIDNAFYLNDCFEPIELDIEPYIIKTFDLTHDREIQAEEKYKVLQLTHRLLDVDSIKSLFLHGINAFKLVNNYHMVSDYPDDYLHLYANTQATYSDRVHACVATLSFGGQAKYYDDSDRSFLFDRLNLEAIREELTSIDNSYIEKEKNEQLAFLKEFIENTI